MIEASKIYPNKIEVAHHLRLTNNSSGPWATCESNDYAVHFYADDEESAEGFIKEIIHANIPLIGRSEIKRSLQDDTMGGYVCDIEYRETIYFN